MFGFSFDKKTLQIIIIVLVVCGLLSFISNPDALIGILFSAPGVLLAITFHEFAHGYAAYKLGDNTAKSQGRLTLNPIAHLDPIGTLMLLVAGFGWGKPVSVNPRNYSRRFSVEKSDAIVSAAGPIMNFILAFILSLIYLIIYRLFPIIISSTMGNVAMEIILYAIMINIGLGVFNLIPLPPLDGSKIIRPLLPNNAKYFMMNNEQIFYMIFILLWITGLAGSVISPIIESVFNLTISLATIIVGIF